MAETDLEKSPGLQPQRVDASQTVEFDQRHGEPSTFLSKIEHYTRSFERQMVAYNLETRGIERVKPEERHSLKSRGFAQIGILWFSINIAANNITLGMLGPVVYYLSFRDAALSAVFGMILVCCPSVPLAITLT